MFYMKSDDGLAVVALYEICILYPSSTTANTQETTFCL